MSRAEAAIAAYHAGLTDESAAESAAWLDARLAERGLTFGERPLCTVLRPRFLTPAQYASLRSELGVLLGAFRKANDAALADPALLAQFGLEAWEETMLRALPRPRTATPLSRIDAFFTAGEGGLKVTEYNAETPAGVAYGDALAELFLALPVARDVPAALAVGADAGPTQRARGPGGGAHRALRPRRAGIHRNRGLARGSHPERVPALPGVLLPAWAPRASWPIRVSSSTGTDGSTRPGRP